MKAKPKHTELFRLFFGGSIFSFIITLIVLFILLVRPSSDAQTAYLSFLGVSLALFIAAVAEDKLSTIVSLLKEIRDKPGKA